MRIDAGACAIGADGRGSLRTLIGNGPHASASISALSYQRLSEDPHNNYCKILSTSYRPTTTARAICCSLDHTSILLDSRPFVLLPLIKIVFEVVINGSIIKRP